MEHTQAGSMQEETRLPPSRGVSYIPYHTIPYQTHLKIWNARIQELFTEFKKLVVVKFCAIANSARFAKCREMYRISHIVEFGLKIQGGDSFLGAG